MKKIISIFSAIFMFSVIGCITSTSPYEENGRRYTSRGSSVDKSISLYLDTPMHLPENRVNDFLPTLEIIFEKSEALDYSFGLSYYKDKNSRLSPPNPEDIQGFYASFSVTGGSSVNAEKNESFDKNVTDTKDVNYYTMFVLMNGTDYENKEIKTKVYFRQLEAKRPAVAVMIMLKNENENGNYEYLVDVKTGDIQVYKYSIDGEATPLPDYLK